MQAIELELEVTVKTHEVRSEYEQQIEERAMMAKERTKLIEEQRNLRPNPMHRSLTRETNGEEPQSNWLQMLRLTIPRSQQLLEAPQRPDKGAPEVPIPMKLPPKGQIKGHQEAPIPMKLPGAMRSTASNGSNLFRERNSDKADQSGVNKEAGVPAPRSPLRQNKTSDDEKENCGL
ncbi:hypothetical protein J5N97_000452 [Dioscorea zingiberensis]|uniref:Uncharacterized protein n=1 Tax=Dioscorea zingiberensis TaxID=325984 RepID=A0A9D5BSE1_9LILI|nr:hypothetical protein J5N97_000452 [Dioscorea zingiberensis]